MVPSTSIISVQNLSHAYGERHVLKDVSLDVEPGQIMAVMGSSGGGKTTLLRCISGLITPTEGKVIVDGLDVQDSPEEARKHMGMVFQSAALFDYLTVEQNILFGVRRYRKLNAKQKKDLVAEMLDIVGLESIETLMPDQLSGGMKKRVGIARALALRPSVMLYDEPTTGLDPISTYAIDQLIVHLGDKVGVTSLVVSHDVSSVFRVADQIAFLDDGELAFCGSPNEFGKSPNVAIRDLIEKSEARELNAN